MIIGGILAPTASGKTALSIEIAQKLGAEIINADSRQIFKDFKIGTAQPNTEALARVKHHCVGFAGPNEEFSTGHFQKKVIEILNENPEKKYLVVGGTGFYFKTLLEGISKIPLISNEIKENLLGELEEKGIKLLHSEIKDFDSFNYNRLAPTDTHRVLRAHEVFRQTGKAWSWFDTQPKIGAIEFPLFTIETERNVLYERINQRCSKMLEGGWQSEIKSLLAKGFSDNSRAMHSLGYPEVIELLQNKSTQQETLVKISQSTRRYAKRQLTFLNNQFKNLIKVGAEIKSFPINELL